MAKLQIIHCEDCGSPRLTKYANTKYCEICRLARNLNFMRGQKFTCAVSKNRFAPIKRGQIVSLTCDPYALPGSVEGTCGICEKDGKLYGEHVRVCVECLDSIDKREEIYGMLLLKQKLIKEGEIEIPEPELPEKVVKTEAHDDGNAGI